jgi:hypothetical protein
VLERRRGEEVGEGMTDMFDVDCHDVVFKNKTSS